MLHTGGRLSHFLDSLTCGARSSYYSWHTYQPSNAEWTRRRFSFVRKKGNLLWCPTLWWFRKRILLGASGGVFKLPTYFLFFPHSTTLVVSFSHTPPVTKPTFLFFFIRKKCSSSVPSPSSLLLHLRLCPLQFPSKVLVSSLLAMSLLEMWRILPSLSREAGLFPTFTTPATPTFKASLLTLVSILFYCCVFTAEYFHRGCC